MEECWSVVYLMLLRTVLSVLFVSSVTSCYRDIQNFVLSYRNGTIDSQRIPKFEFLKKPGFGRTRKSSPPCDRYLVLNSSFSTKRLHHISTMVVAARGGEEEPLSSSPNDNNDEEDTILLTKDVLVSSSTRSNPINGAISRVEPFQIDESEADASVASSSSSSSLRHGSANRNRNRPRRRRRRRNQKPSTPRQARIRYFILSTLAVILTIACPQTNLVVVATPTSTLIHHNRYSTFSTSNYWCKSFCFTV
jgi:hypothetical protein